MSILVTGALGFVGKNLVKKYHSKTEIVCADIFDSPPEEFSDINYVKLDITNKEDVTNLFNEYEFDAVIHLAAHQLNASWKNPILNAKVNIIGSLNIIQNAIIHDSKIVFSSASSVIGKAKEGFAKEMDAPMPTTPYGVAKRSVEHYLRVFSESKSLKYTIFRFFNIYGPYQYPQSGGLIPNVLSRIHNGEEVIIFGKGDAARDFVYIEDIVDFLMEAAKNNIKGLFNLGTGIPTTIKQIVNLASEVVGKDAQIKHMPERPGEIKNFAADTSKLRNAFGHVPSMSVQNGLENTYKWLKTIL